jgi:hypothetical protein
MRTRAVGVGLMVSVALFALLIELAIEAYPGGTWFDPRAPGHDIFRNFLCDLTQPVAINGMDNARGAVFAKAAMIALDVGLLLVWWSLPWLCPPSPYLRALRILGTISFLGIVAVPLTPSLRLGSIHAAAVFAGAIPGIAAGVLASLMLRRSTHTRISKVGIAILVVSAADAALYAHHVAFDAPTTIAQPLLQRVALVLLLGWMVAIGVRLLTGVRRPA